MSEAMNLTQHIGQAENALRAVLDRLLAETGITFGQWVTLTMLARGGSGSPIEQEALVRQVSGALKCDAPTVLAALDALTARGLVTMAPERPGCLTLTTDGAAQFQRLRQRINGVTDLLYGDLPLDDLATTQRVLGIVAERANLELGRQS